ncbi:hypothetical protein [Maribacter sp.]|uniref:hypothetical protein n=1 Tax=Maribacter sp. TaxID=1897614 RepID=UPI0025C14B41|nr:hypothetical protein [Maribacter sp.]
METITLQHPKRQSKNVPRFGNGTVRAHKVKRAAFRLSDLDVSDTIALLDNESNDLLFQIATHYIPRFDTETLIAPDQLTDHLLNAIAQHFNIDNPKSIAVGEDRLVVLDSLEHDFYMFDFSTFTSLRYRSPKLYECFCTLLRGLKLPFVEAEETQYFYMDYFEFILDGMSKRDQESEKRHFQKAVRTIDHIKEGEMTLRESISQLNNYKPTNKVYANIKTFLLEWSGTQFTFSNSAPYEYYESDEDIEQFDKSIEQRTDVYDRIGMFCSKGASFNRSFNQSMQEDFNNSYLLNPCWTITIESAQIDLRDEISDFKRFSTEFYRLVSALEKK